MISAAGLVMSAVPVLCFDTCSLLDIMRDPSRDTVRLPDRIAGLKLLEAAEAGKLQCFLPEQVATEFNEHDRSTQEEAQRAIIRLREQVGRINALDAVYGPANAIDLAHLDDHVARAREVVGRWLAQVNIFKPGDGAPGKAFARVNTATPPAVKGKESSKDCLIYETLLELASGLRKTGTTTPVVFLSSNINEYLLERKTLKPEIAAEFAPIKVDYAQNMGLAKHLLGL
jgi:PIN domain